MKVICIDIESTGPDPAKDRIIQLAWASATVQGQILVDPMIPIPPESTAAHGIKPEDVVDKPPFMEEALYVHQLLAPYDCILGFNHTNFDVPLLWEEFYRCGIEWDLSNVKLLDAGTLFKRREERTLSAAVAFYCSKSHDGAHDAMADVLATWQVWDAQQAKYGLFGKSADELAKESNYEEVRVDLAGKIVIGKDGRPAYNIGKAKGTAVVDDPGFGYWMLDKDFCENTKMHLRRIFNPQPVASLLDEVAGDGDPF
jgi:DNA polymerase-3 subunit epsilon